METQIPLWLFITVVAVALSVGALMIGVVLHKYFHQWFHVLGGPILTGFGVILIGLTVYGNVRLKAGEFEFKIDRLQTALNASQFENRLLVSQLAAVQDKFASIQDAVHSTTEYVNDDQNLSKNQELVAKVQATGETVKKAIDVLGSTLAHQPSFNEAIH